jgi:uncharacterized DUF497 family protein
MGVTYKHHGQVFEWNAAKAALNLRKHNISFEHACVVFFDPFVRLVDASDSGETREAVIGLIEDWSMLFVVHVVRDTDTIRIVSARPATPPERRVYEDE